MRYFLLLFPLIFFSCASGDTQATANPACFLPNSSEYCGTRCNVAREEIRLDTFFRRKFVEGTFSGCVLIAERGRIMYERAFGWENHEQRDSLSLESSFQLASVSKQFTAAAILLLVQNGELSLKDSLRKFFPELPYSNVTVHDLLCHRAGMDKYTNICDNYYREQEIDPPADYTNDSVVALFSRLQVRAIRKPDEKYDYSNTGFVFLASIVEHVSGMSFHAFMVGSPGTELEFAL